MVTRLGCEQTEYGVGVSTSRRRSLNTLTTFFKGSGTQLGIFSPTHYVVAVFKNFELAQLAARRLRETGIGEDEVAAVPGEEMLRFAGDNVKEHWFSALMMQALSRLFETEGV